MSLPVVRVVLYKHGVGYFEREGTVDGDTALTLTFKQAEVSDVLKSLTVLDLDGGHVASVSYDSTRPLAQLLQDVALSIPDQNSLVGLLPQIRGARVAVASPEGACEGIILGVDTTERRSADGVVTVVLVSLVSDAGAVRQFDLHGLTQLEILDPALRRDLDYYLRTELSAKKKDARSFTLFARGEGRRRVRVSYTLEAPVWKATYRILIGEEGQPPTIQGWAVVDNTGDEDWEGVELALVAGLPVSFVHDLYTPRYLKRPVVAVAETTGVVPPLVEEGVELAAVARKAYPEAERAMLYAAAAPPVSETMMRSEMRRGVSAAAMATSTPAQVRERKIGDLFEYRIEHPVTIRRNQSALVPIVLRPFEGRPVLLHNRDTRPNNPMRCVELKNTTGLTLEGGPVTVLEGGSYVGEAMLETLKPDERRLVPYAVELSVHVLDNVNSWNEEVHRVVIRDGQLTCFAAEVRQTTYHLDSKGDAEATVYLDHRRDGRDWKLFDTAEPEETTENYWRFRFPLPARRTTAFVVKQQHTTRQVQSLGDIDPAQLAHWLDQKHVDAATDAVLRQVIEAQHTVAACENELARLREERDALHRDQERIRKNLESLGDKASERELRERFVRTLNAQEDRLEAIVREEAAKAAARDQAREKVNALLARLEYSSRASGST